MAVTATTRDIYEPIVHHLGGSVGIVKHGGMSACRMHLLNQLACLAPSTTKLRDRFVETLEDAEHIVRSTFNNRRLAAPQRSSG
jgi:hypothetical protein